MFSICYDDQSLIAPRSIDRTRLLTCPRPTHLRRFDITQTANANWREAEYTKQRARSAESELASANETIRTLEAKLMTTESRLAHEKRGVAAELQRTRDAAAEQTARHDNRVAQLQQTMDARFESLHDRHRKLQSEMAALQASIPAAAGGAVGVADVETELESERRLAEETRLRNVELDLKESHTAEFENLEQTKDGQIKNLKDQTAYFLAKKDDELRAADAEHERYRKEKEAECERLHKECEYLHGWAMSMNAVVENVEAGAYPFVEAGGLRTLTIPAGDKPGTLDVPQLASRAEDARRFLEETSTMFRTGASVGAGGVNDGVAGGASPGAIKTFRSTGESTVAPGGAADAFELEAFRAHGDLIDAERAAVADATLRELSSHPTVEYIRHLEEENERITAALSKERRSVSDMRVALNSANRQVVENATLSRVSSARHGGASGGGVASRATAQSKGLLTTTLRGTGGGNLAAGTRARDPVNVAFGSTTTNPATSGPFRDSETNALVRTHRAGLHKTNPYASGGARPAFMNPPDAYVSATNYHPKGVGPHVQKGNRTAAFGYSGSQSTHAQTSTLTRVTADALNERAARTREGEVEPTLRRRAEARVAERDEAEKTRGVRAYLETQAAGLRTGVGGATTIGIDGSYRGGGGGGGRRTGAPLGGASGRLASDRVPLPGRPISGTAEVGYGWILGDGMDKDGGTVGWPKHGPGSVGVDVSRSKYGSHTPSAANAVAGSSWRHAPDVFGVTRKVGEQRGDGVRAAMVMVPAEVAPAAGAATPAVEPPPGAAR